MRTSACRAMAVIAMAGAVSHAGAGQSFPRVRQGEFIEAHFDRAAETAESFRGRQDGWAGGREQAATWSDAVQGVQDPASVCAAVRGRVQYTDDAMPEDNWQTGRRTWDRGKGDCEDFAMAVHDLCAEKGIASGVYTFVSKSRRAGHAATVGQRDGALWMSSNGSYRKVGSLDEAKRVVAQEQGWDAGDVIMWRAYGTAVEDGQPRNTGSI